MQVCFVFSIKAQTVPPAIQAAYGCEPDVPFIVVDFTGDPAGFESVNVAERDNYCCGASGPTGCFVIQFTLDPNSVGVNINLAGAGGFGSVEMSLNGCPNEIQIGDPICVSDPGPHEIVFCKPGTNDYFVEIQAIPAPSGSGDVVTADGCQDTLSVTGLIGNTITWTSITPGAEGEFNHYLNNLGGSNPGTAFVDYVDPGGTVVVVPQIGGPSSITYEVCGTPVTESVCPSSTPIFCDTSSVTIYPTLFADILPDPVAVCAGGIAQELTAHPIGGTAPYNYTWTTAADPTINGASTQSVFVTVPGVYSVSIGDITGCPLAGIPIGTYEVIVQDCYFVI